MEAFCRACITIGRLALITVLSATSLVSTGLAQHAVPKNAASGADCQFGSSTRGTRFVTDECPLPTTVAVEDTGNPYEQNQLGIASALVLGPGRSITDARKWFEKSARQGYAPAQVNLGVLYAYGWGTAQNFGAALYWLKAGADQGSARGKTNLGILYLKGWGVKQDYEEALQYFRSAAKGGDAGAMVNLGFMSDSGLGIPVDHAEAAEWYRKAAERGDPLGQNNLADLYLRG